MQDMTSEICKDSSVATGSTKQLKDSRDNKYYWIAKLADGNCWMTQNLDFDIPAALYRNDSDVLIDTLTNTAKVTAPNRWSGNTDTYNAHYDPGDYIYNGPSDPAHGQGTACSANNSSADALAPCAQFSKSSIDNTNAQVLGDTNRHYHVGNYYSFSAATAKSGDDLTSGSALQSICPKGWSLPTGSSNGQFTELLAKYGVDSSLASGNYAIYKEPLYFVYGGGLYSSTLDGAGYRGYYWSSTVNSGTGAFDLYFNSRVYPASNSSRSDGFSVRCVAK